MWSVSPTEHALHAMLAAHRVEERMRVLCEYVEQMRSRYCLDVDDVTCAFVSPNVSDPITLYTPYAHLYNRILCGRPVSYPTMTLACNTAFFESPHLVPTLLCAVQRMFAHCRQHTLLKHQYGIYPHDATSVKHSNVQDFIEHVVRYGPAFVYPQMRNDDIDTCDQYHADAAHCVAAYTDDPHLMAWFLRRGLVSDCIAGTTFEHVLEQGLQQQCLRGNVGVIVHSDSQ